MTDVRQELLALEKQLRALDRKQRFNQLAEYVPYPKQIEFHNLGATYMERLLRAGNRVGKSFCGAAEVAFHLTGRYPAWWKGRRFDRPVKVWAASDTGTTVRDIVQSKLCGPYGVTDLQGAGAIPHDCVNWEKDVSLARGVTDLYDTVLVSHETNGIKDGKSILTFKTYEQGRKKWQGEAVDVVWNDEEPPEDVYSEGITRLTATREGDPNGIALTTFTPLEGKTKIVLKFEKTTPERIMVSMALSDAKHISPAARAQMLAIWPEHERMAREFGVPMLGEGRIFTFQESQISVPPFAPVSHWAYIWGTDFGINHPFAAALLGWDRDTDTIYVMKVLKMTDSLPLQHVAAMKSGLLNRSGNLVPMAWPQDGHQRQEFDGKLEPLAKIYKSHGQRVCDHHATFSDGSNSTEAGIMEMQERFQTGRLKVFSDCSQWFEEYRDYHRKEGKIFKERDDLMSATRTGLVAIRFARPVLFHPNTPTGRTPVAMARDIDLGPWDR